MTDDGDKPERLEPRKVGGCYVELVCENAQVEEWLLEAVELAEEMAEDQPWSQAGELAKLLEQVRGGLDVAIRR